MSTNYCPRVTKSRIILGISVLSKHPLLRVNLSRDTFWFFNTRKLNWYEPVPRTIPPVSWLGCDHDQHLIQMFQIIHYTTTSWHANVCTILCFTRCFLSKTNVLILPGLKTKARYLTIYQQKNKNNDLLTWSTTHVCCEKRAESRSGTHSWRREMGSFQRNQRHFWINSWHRLVCPATRSLQANP